MQPTKASVPVVYLLKCNNGTYIGATLNLDRRLRQHNGQLAGGARQTANRGPWEVACKVTGFNTLSEALKFEYSWRREGRKLPRGLAARRMALEQLSTRQRWSSKSPLAVDVPLQITWFV